MLTAGSQIGDDGFALIVAIVRRLYPDVEIMFAHGKLQFRDLVHFYRAEDRVPLIVPVEGLVQHQVVIDPNRIFFFTEAMPNYNSTLSRHDALPSRWRLARRS